VGNGKVAEKAGYESKQSAAERWVLNYRRSNVFINVYASATQLPYHRCVNCQNFRSAESPQLREKAADRTAFEFV